ncbi:PGF-pre-PGF domain-containing protein [Candidatus Woesearchaeota archaeon]|nr:PGF-pre-PGF domain-containing protein [Candidatus Woesearchaeota archaeon]
MEKKNVLYALFIVGLMAIFTVFVFGGDELDLQMDLGVTLNTSNSTWTTDTTPTFSFTYSDGDNATCQLLLDNGTVLDTMTGVSNTTISALSNITSTKTLPSGVHNWGINCSLTNLTDALSSDNYSVEIMDPITVTAPVDQLGQSNFTAQTLDFTFSFTSTLAGSKDISCALLIDNSTIDASFGTNTSTLSGTSTIINNSVALPNGTLSWRINCTMNGTDISSADRTLIADDSPPVLSSSNTDVFTPNNWTWTDDDTPTFTFNFTDEVSENATCNVYADEVEVASNATAYNDTLTTLTSSQLSSGVNKWYVNCTDLAGNVGTSLLAINDSHRLEVITVSVSAPGDNSWTSATAINGTSFIFDINSVLLNDSQTAGANNKTECTLWMTNNTTGWMMGIDKNFTVGSSETVTMHNENLTFTNAWAMNWTMNCSWNGSQITAVNDGHFVLNVDTIAPSSVLLSEFSKTSNSLTIAIATSTDVYSCTTSDATATITGSGASWTLTDGGLSSSTPYDYQVTCKDRALNSRTSATLTVTTNSVPGGGGAGGSGGGSSIGTTGQFAQKTWSSLNAGETATIDVDNGEIGVTQINVEMKDTTYGAWIKVEKVDNFPASVGTPDNVYKKIKMVQSNIEKAMKDVVQVKFKVAKSWLIENKVGRDNIVMLRFADEKWKELETAFNLDDGVYIHYTSETPGFSYFAIGEKVGAEPVDAVEEVIGEVVDEPEIVTPEEVVAPATSMTWLWVLLGVVLIAVVVWLVWFRKKK